MFVILQLKMWQDMEQKAQEEKKQFEKEKEEKAKEKAKEGDKAKGLEEIKEEEAEEEEHKVVLPDWLEKYILYKFNLYDRTGNNVIEKLCNILIYCDVPGSPCLSKNKANQMCNSFFLEAPL